MHVVVFDHHLEQLSRVIPRRHGNVEQLICVIPRRHRNVELFCGTDLFQ